MPYFNVDYSDGRFSLRFRSEEPTPTSDVYVSEKWLAAYEAHQNLDEVFQDVLLHHSNAASLRRNFR